MKILVIGKGFIGKPLTNYLGADTIDTRICRITGADLTSYDVVINTAAKTNIDWCEQNKNETFNINVFHAIRLARLIKKGKYVFFSSGCIFKSDTPDEINYEDSIPNPQCFYTYTKLMADQLLQESHPDTLILRPRLIISQISHPKNTINKLLSYSKIVNTRESATVLEDMLPKVKQLIMEDAKGPYNIFNEGTISPTEIMNIFKHPYEEITKQQLDDMTKGRARRVSTILGSTKTKPLPEIRKRIKEIKEFWNISTKSDII